MGQLHFKPTRQLLRMAITLLIVCSLISTVLSDVEVYAASNKLIESLDDQIAGFGPSLPTAGIKGYLTTTNPANACQRISLPPFRPTDKYPWIALIPRTNGNDSCEFATKVQNAQNANFSAVIIYNYDDTLISMSSSSKMRIPATMVSHTDGKSLIAHYLFNKTYTNGTSTYYVKITPDPPFKFGPYVIVFVVLTSVSILAVIGFMLVKCHLQRRQLHRHRLPRSALKQLKVKKFVKTDPWEVCVICLDDFEEGAKLRILPCDHAYHMKCIDPWLINNRRQCPVCKRYVFPNLDHSDEEETGHRPQPIVSTERTPLVRPDRTDTIAEISPSRQFPRHQLIYSSSGGFQAALSSSNDSSDSIENVSSSSRPTTTSDTVSPHPTSNYGRYGSLRGSATTTQRLTTTASLPLGVEDVSDIETADEDDDRMRSVITDSGDNPAYISDDVSASETAHTHL